MRWFRGPDVSEPREREFVAALRRAAEEDALPGVDPGDTIFDRMASPFGPGIALDLKVPKLTCPNRWLLVSYAPGSDKGAPLLRSDWDSEPDLTTEPRAYDGPSSDNNLFVTGIAATPTECAAWVIRWIAWQLHRPVIRREWDQPATGPGAGIIGGARAAAAVEWWLGEPEELLDARGTFVRWRLVRQPHTRQIHERP